MIEKIAIDIEAGEGVMIKPIQADSLKDIEELTKEPEFIKLSAVEKGIHIHQKIEELLNET